MTLPVVLTDDAQQDLDEAVEWYEDQQVGLGGNRFDRVSEVFRRIRVTPRLHAVVHQDVRKAVLPRFPYLIRYRVEEERIVIIAVHHSSRDPSTWQHRVPPPEPSSSGSGESDSSQ